MPIRKFHVSGAGGSTSMQNANKEVSRQRGRGLYIHAGCPFRESQLGGGRGLYIHAEC